MDQQWDLLPIICVSDCKSLCEAVKSSKVVSDKRVRMQIRSLKELLGRKQIQDITWFPTNSLQTDVQKGTAVLPLLEAISEGVWGVDSL